MSLIELTNAKTDRPFTVNLEHVTEFFPLGSRTQFMQTSVLGSAEGLDQASVTAAEEYREIVAVLRTHQGAPFIPARDLIARARALGSNPE